MLVLSLPERGIEPLERNATLRADGDRRVADVPITYPGRWHLRIDALVADFNRIALEDDVDVPALTCPLDLEPAGAILRSKSAEIGIHSEIFRSNAVCDAFAP